MYHGIAFADHWRGPYRKLTPHKPIPLETDCEDPYLFRDPVRICLLARDGCSGSFFADVWVVEMVKVVIEGLV